MLTESLDRFWSETTLLMCTQLKKTVEELNDALATKEEISQRCRELDLQVTSVWDLCRMRVFVFTPLHLQSDD